jgi:hypothetical protein
MSAARKKALADPEVRARMSAARKKAWADPEVRARMSAARKKALADPEVRARMSAASKKALADPEVRARMSAASKKAWQGNNPLANLTERQRRIYRALRRKGVGTLKAIAEAERAPADFKLPRGRSKDRERARRFCDAWREGLSIALLAERFNLKPASVSALAAKLDLPPRRARVAA